jgi:hypothetical protein
MMTISQQVLVLLQCFIENDEDAVYKLLCAMSVLLALHRLQQASEQKIITNIVHVLTWFCSTAVLISCISTVHAGGL